MSKKALVVEDDVNIAELLMLYLEKDGFEVSIAHDGGRGIEMFNETSPDLVLLDVMMPVMDGLEATSEIRTMNRSDASAVVIIAMTANAFTEDKTKALKSGMDDYLTKPLESEKLIRALSRYKHN